MTSKACPIWFQRRRVTLLDSTKIKNQGEAFSGFKVRLDHRCVTLLGWVLQSNHGRIESLRVGKWSFEYGFEIEIGNAI